MLIVGGGVVGLTAAYELAVIGARVTVVDRGELGQEASWAGAGMIPPGGRVSELPSLQRLADESAARWPDLSQQLLELTGIDNEYTRCGSLHVPSTLALSEDEWRHECTDWSRVPQCVLKRDEIRAMAPHLASDQHRVLSLPSAAQVRNPRHLQALLAACQARGVELIARCEVTGLQTEAGRVTGAHTQHGLRNADEFLVTAGAWTGVLLDPETRTLPFVDVGPVRGQIMLLKCPRPPFTTLVESGSRYLVPRRDGRLLIGSTQEWVGFDKQTTAAGLADLHAFAIGLVPELASATIERSWAGLRPFSGRQRPYVGRVPGFTNLTVAAGHFRAGLSLSPVTALLIRDLLCGATLDPIWDELALGTP